jgi:hypothetical protein
VKAPAIILLSGPGRDAVAGHLRDAHGARCLRTNHMGTTALEAFSRLTAYLRFGELHAKDSRLVVWDHDLQQLLGHLPPAHLPLVRRAVSRMLNRYGAVVGMGLRVEHAALAARKLADQAEDNLRLQLPAALNPELRNFGGHAADAEFLFLGDRINPKKPRPGWPFYAVDGSSAHLSQALEAAGIAEWRCCWVNLNDEQGPELARATLLHNSGLLPVLLGSEAQKAWDKAALIVDQTLRGRPAVRLNHPQWYRRFHATDGLLASELATKVLGPA